MNIHYKSFVLFYNQEHIILQDRSNLDKLPRLEVGYWGGGIEIGETPIQAAIREIKEELDIPLQESDLYHFGNYEDIWKDNVIKSDVFLSYWVYSDEEYTVLEGNGLVKLDIETAISKMKYKATRQILLDFKDRFNS